jgi:hypothetical protein
MVSGPFCPYCGLQQTPLQPVYYQYPPQTKASDDFGRIFSGSWIVYFSIFLFAVMAFLGLLWSGASQAVSGILDDACAECKVTLLIITPEPRAILEPFGGIPFIIYYLFVVVTISSCFFWLVYKDLPVALADFKESLKKGWFNIKSKSTLLKIGQLFAFGVFFNIAYNLIVLIFLGEGILPAETEVSPAWFFLSLVASAAVWEEIVARTLLIGIPLLAIAVFTMFRTGKRIDRPVKYLIGGGFKIGYFESVFLLFSASMFGWAHTYSGGPMVFPPLFVGGMILGYLFLKKGIIASIVFHFVWNYSIALNYMAALTGNWTLMGLGIAFTLMVAFVGLVVAITYLVKWSRSAQEKAQVSEAGQAQTGAQAPMRQQSALPSGYQCPNCGWQAAVYKDGHFNCLRCGHIT